MRYESDITPKISKIQFEKKNKLYTKNVFFFFLLAKFLTKSKISIFVNRSRKKSTVILRAPYRYKLGRLQLLKNSYNITINIKYLCRTLYTYESRLLAAVPNDISSGITNLKCSHTNTQIKYLKNFKLNSFIIIIVYNFF